ncbi:hypothetical protein [Halioxenophilus aromaticivorans]|uniref:Uncharacterized protein n=1 Tax=Halioxenophilus aromaticivorans TaxID=1306992 RepID=A0AAV3U3H4_9ALTE
MKHTILARGAALVTAAVFCNQAMAHAGHDHNHWSSPALHALAVMAVAAVGAGVWVALRQRKQKAKLPTQQEK